MSTSSTIHDARFEAMLKMLREARVAKELTQEELSSRLSKHRIYINKVESGQRRVDVAELFDICKELDLSIYSVIQSTFDNKASISEQESPDYLLGFSNGYLIGREHKKQINKKEN